MNDLAGKQFGLIIAYVLPGFVAIWALQPFFSTLRVWLSASPSLPAGVESVFFVTLASTAAGMTVSAFRWGVVDMAHALTGLPRPQWDDSNLPDRLDAFDLIVEAHYRYYQFYSNTFVSGIIVLAAGLAAHQPWVASPLHIGLLIVTESVFFAMSRDTLRKYYVRTSRLLGTLNSTERKDRHGKRQHAQQADATGKAKF
jgi:hypothetical protein